jgi:hypothetical protein
MGAETLLAVGAGTQILGGITSAIQGKQAAKFNEAMAFREAELARQEAGIESRRLREDAELIRQEGRREVGARIAKAGASGVVATQGSPLLVLLDTARRIERQALRREEDARTALFRGEVSAIGSETEARLQRQAGRQAILKGILGVGQAGVEFGTQRSKFKQLGVIR